MFLSRSRRSRRRSFQVVPTAAEIQTLETRTLLSATVVEHDNVAYFLSDANAQVLRYDIANEAWKAPFDVTPGVGVPSVLHVDDDGVYVAFKRAVYRYDPDGSNATHLLNATSDVIAIQSDGDFLFINNGASQAVQVISVSKQSNTIVDTIQAGFTQIYGVSASTSTNRLFGRTMGRYPSDIASISYDDSGNFLSHSTSPYHGDYPDASRTWIFPDGQRVLDDSGTVYSANSLSYLASFNDAFDDITFSDHDVPFVLRGNQIVEYGSELFPAASYTMDDAGQEIFVNDTDVIVFRFDSGQWQTTSVPLTDLHSPQPDAPVDPVGLSYVPDQVEQGADGTLLLLSSAHQSIFVWDAQQQIYVDSIPLAGSPHRMAYSSTDNSVYLTYDDRLIRRMDLSAAQLTEEPLVTLSDEIGSLTVAGQYVLATVDRTHVMIDSGGTIIDSVPLYSHGGDEYVWSEVNQKFYYLSVDSVPRKLHSIEVNQNGSAYPGEPPGSIVRTHDPPYRSGLSGYGKPVHVSPDGNVVLLGTGLLYDPTTLDQSSTGLANRIDDAAWIGSTIVTADSHWIVTELQKWEGATYQETGSRHVDESFHALVNLSDEHVVLITIKDDIPQFRKLDSDLQDVARPPRKFTLTSSIVDVNESAGPDAVQIILERTGDLSEPLEVNLTSSDESAMTVPDQVTIPANQPSIAFSVATIDDELADGAQAVTILASGRQYDIGELTFSVTDNELIVTETDDETVVSEDGATDTFLVSLPVAPASSVVVDVTPAADSGLSVDTSVLRFTPENWDVPQSVTVTGTDDSVSDGDTTSSIHLSVASDESDVIFAASAPQIVVVTTLDNEPPRPVIIPPDTITDAPVLKLEWTGVPLAETYDLWLTKVGSEDAPTVLSTDKLYHQFENLPIGDYNFWVRAQLSTGETSAWGFHRFKLDKPVSLELTSSGQQDRAPELSWAPILGATGYQVWANNVTTRETGFLNTVVTETSFSFSDLSFGLHRFWVRAIGENGFLGRWSAEESYYLGPAVDVRPQATFGTRPEFHWDTVDGIAQFRIWISGPQGFVIDQTGITETSFTPEVDLPVGEYRWWVMPQTADGRNGRWSHMGTSNVGGGVAGLEMVGEPSDSSPILRWQPTEGASSYEVYGRQTETGYVERSSDITTTELQLPLMVDGHYKFWVRPFDDAGHAGRWSPAFEYSMQAATTDVEVTAVDAQVLTFNSHVVFEWNRPTDVNRFDLVYVDVATDSETELHDLTGSQFSVADAPRGRYAWSVRVRTDDGAVGPWSQPAMYDNTGQTRLNMPQNSTTTQPQPVIHWQAVLETDRYSLVIIDQATDQTVYRDDHLTDTSHHLASPLAAGTYRVWIKAISNSDGAFGIWSQPVTLTVTSVS